MDGTNAIPRLDQLFQCDQFQTRPLIWKAYLLEQEGRLEEAEKTVRQAIAVDPSDGESGRGDRMRAYAELADIRAARGDLKEADFYRQIVKAIRISEDADQYYDAGLLKHAVAMYQEGLDHFADAYCIQSRMAIQLAAMGKTAEAEEHYRRAYELMPDSFGRVESHCFGCEQVFAGQRAQSVAEKVFKVLAADRPNKPQVYYLLGYLYTEENRYTEAWTNFQIAVRLDPDYLNAWGKLQDLSRAVPVPPQKRDEIVFNLIRLDPLQRHTNPNFGDVTDVRRLWDAVAAASKLQPTPSTNLFELTASKIALQNRARAADPNTSTFMSADQQNQNQNLSPGQAIAQTPFIALAGQLILSGVNLNQ
jgi:tetratricopeptide (TPR) repeat protein